MLQLGKVLHLSKNRMLVLRCESGKPQKEKASVFNEGNLKIGVISEIFGPVKKPYVTVKPQKSIDTAKQVGETLYIK